MAMNRNASLSPLCGSGRSEIELQLPLNKYLILVSKLLLWREEVEAKIAADSDAGIIDIHGLT